MPLVVDGDVVGAVGVSGASSADEDQELAVVAGRAQAAAAGRRREAVFFPRQVVREKFETGGLLVDTPGTRWTPGRRTAPGEVELHDDVVDIMHVVEGEATRRWPGDRATHQLGEGDVLVIPQGVPHQFVDVSEPFLYFVAKVEA